MTGFVHGAYIIVTLIKSRIPELGYLLLAALHTQCTVGKRVQEDALVYLTNRLDFIFYYVVHRKSQSECGKIVPTSCLSKEIHPWRFKTYHTTTLSELCLIVRCSWQ